MEFRYLGATGVQVSRLALGTMMFGAIGNTDHDDAVRVIQRALDAGINLVDTADMYSAGESEEIVGTAREARPQHVITPCPEESPCPSPPRPTRPPSTPGPPVPG